MKKTLNPQSPEFRDLVASLTSSQLNISSTPTPHINPNQKIGFTGQKDADTAILMRLDDKELEAVCSVNKYVNALCEKQSFWLSRIIYGLKKTCELASRMPIYKDIIGCELFEESIKPIYDYFGFTHYRELYNYFNKFTKGEQLSISFFILNSEGELYFENLVNKVYTVFRDKLPKFVNYQELIYYLRRKIVKQFYRLEKGDYYPEIIKLSGLLYNKIRIKNKYI
jgi:hypothetical protein